MEEIAKGAFSQPLSKISSIEEEDSIEGRSTTWGLLLNVEKMKKMEENEEQLVKSSLN